MRTALADTAQIMQGGLPPYLRAAIVPGQGGRLCRGTRPALALWRRLLFREDGRNADGFSRHRTNNAGRFTALP